MRNKLISMELVFLLIIWGFIGLVDLWNENASAYTPHNPIYIEGNDDFSDGDDDGVINPSSAGTEGDPYIIEGWEINASTANGIEIRNTTVYFIIRDCYVHGSESPYLGIWFFNVTNGKIEDSNVSKNWQGIHLNQSSSSTINNNSVLNNDYGIYISGSRNIIFNNSICFNDYTGLYLSGSNNNISQNNVSNNGDGIHLNLSSYTKIFSNSIYSNNGSGVGPGYGIILSSGSSNTIYYNNISGNGNHINISGCGMWLISSSNNTINHNKIRSNDIFGIKFSSSSNNIISNNNIQDHCGEGMRLQLSSNNKIFNNYFLENVACLVIQKSTYNTVFDNGFDWMGLGICLSFSSYNTVYSNKMLDIGYGIYLSSSQNNTISDNNILIPHSDGIHLTSSSNNTISNNLVRLGDERGIFLWSNSNTNKIICNNISNNQECGINISGSINNYIYHNDIIDNIIQAYDDTNKSNQWDNGYPCGGNYWSDFDEPSEGAYDDYQGPNQNVVGNDGIVDNGTGLGGGKNPYIIDADSKDRYPLLYPLMSLNNYTILKHGWNLISIPSIQNNTSLSTVLQPLKGEYNIVQWYNSTDLSKPWKQYHISKPPHLNDLNEVNHKIGFWVHITNPDGAIFRYDGLEPTKNQTIKLNPGWNLVGYPSLSNKNRTSALNNLNFSEDVDSIWTFNAIIKEWEEIDELDYFEIGKGYWIHAPNEKSWEVPL